MKVHEGEKRRHPWVRISGVGIPSEWDCLCNLYSAIIKLARLANSFKCTNAQKLLVGDNVPVSGTDN